MLQKRLFLAAAVGGAFVAAGFLVRDHFVFARLEPALDPDGAPHPPMTDEAADDRRAELLDLSRRTLAAD